MNTQSSRTMSTDQLLDLLCEDLPKSAKYVNPLWYLISWFGLSALAVLMYLTTMLNVRFDLIMRIADPVFVTGVIAALAASGCFAYAALIQSIPARSSKGITALGCVCTAVWLAPIFSSMLMNVNPLLAGEVFIRFSGNTYIHVFIAGLIPIALLWYFVHKLAPTNPKKIAKSVSIAAFMLSATLMRFFYVHLFNGADDGYALFLWIVVPFVCASAICGALTVPWFGLHTPAKYTAAPSNQPHTVAIH